MRWITASQLETWARTVGSRTKLSEMISDLIRATADDINAIRIPSGDKGQVRGFDGRLFSVRDYLNVPAGESIWELSTEKEYKEKAQKEFEKRTHEVSEAEQRTTTLVLVTAWTWDSSDPKNKVEDWVAERKSQSAWKDIKFIDGSALQTWLECCPAVAAWHAARTLSLAPVEGVRSTSEFWSEYSGQFGPSLTPDVLLCEREVEAQQVIDGILKQNNAVYCVADSQDEAIAFVVAAITRAPHDIRLFLEAHTIVVDTATAGRFLHGSKPLILLLRNDATRSPAQFSDIGTTFVPLGRAQPTNRAAIALSRPTGQAMGKALMTMGFSENESLTLARGSGRSLTALARLKPGGSPQDPSWITDGIALLPAVLAGAWDSSRAHDREVIEQLADGTSIGTIEARLRQHLNGDDPPFDLEGAVWKLRAPLDAFVRAGILIRKEDAERLRSVATSVFGQLEEETDPGDLIATARSAAATHSEWLREGLATTLLLLAVWSEPGRVNLGGETGPHFVNRLLQELPGLTTDYRLLASLRRELPLLAEAAPDPLLSALERLLEGNGERIAPIFLEKEGYIFPTAKHTGLLWALETLAWDPAYFDRSVLALARLAAIDPGGRLTNRPIQSLAAIFLPWYPQTNANAPQRLAALARIAARTPAVGWTLITKLLPTLYGTTTPTAKPRLREAGAADRPPITIDDLAAMHSNVFNRALDLAATRVDRWTTLIAALGTLHDADRERAIQALDRILSQLSEADREPIWDKLRREVSRHETFSDADWALKPSALASMKALVQRYSPSDRVKRVAWVFETLTFDADANLDLASTRRTEALLDLYRHGGLTDILELGLQSKHAHFVVEAIANAKLDEDAVTALLAQSLEQSAASQFTWGLSVLYRRVAGAEKAATWLHDAVATGTLSPDLTASFLLAWPDDPSTWGRLREFGPEIVAAYWKQRPPRFVNGPKGLQSRSLLMLLRYGRASTALASSCRRLGDIPTRLLFKMLDALVSEINSGSVTPDTMVAFYIQRTLEELDKRPKLPVDEIAKREYALLPLIEFSSRKLRIYDLMASSAEFYFQILCEVHREQGDPTMEADDETRGRAQLSYSLLSKFERIPGPPEGEVDGAFLGKWIDDIVRLGAEHDRAEPADHWLGKTLAHGPADDVDGHWPHRALRDQIERLSSQPIEDSIHIERLNMRGSTMRGLFEGGAQERVLAENYLKAASETADWPRTSALLRAIGKSWHDFARDADVRAAQNKLRS
jgi:hypothetical protein